MATTTDISEQKHSHDVATTTDVSEQKHSHDVTTTTDVSKQKHSHDVTTTTDVSEQQLSQSTNSAKTVALSPYISHKMPYLTKPLQHRSPVTDNIKICICQC